MKPTIRTTSKTQNRTCLLLLCASLMSLLPASASDPRPQSRAANQSATARPQKKERKVEADQGFDRTIPPSIGMTRAQVRARYGGPKWTQNSPRGETWSYTFDAWKFRIPYYNLAAKMKTGMVTFNAAGRVTDYQWGQSRSAFMMGM